MKWQLKPFIVIIIVLVFSCNITGQTQLTDHIYTTDKDREVFNRFLSVMVAKKSLPIDQLIIEIATFFLDVPYVASTLEKEPEGLVINLREMDCSTFVENVIALSRTLKLDDPSFENFCRQLQFIRYRNGKVTSYLDRLHYTSDWLYENDRKEIVEDINKKTGGIPIALKLNFMSTHPDSYKQLKAQPELIAGISQIENDINSRSYFYIPKQSIDNYASKIKSGDMVCFTTAIKGLDISHVGIIIRVGEKLTFIHASTSAKKVIINQESLKEYLERGKNNTGIILARPL